MSYQSFQMTSEEKENLRGRLLQTSEVTPFHADPKFFSCLAALGIHQEVGTIHDEFAKFLFDARTGEQIPLDSLRSELIQYRDHYGVRIWAEGFDRLDPRVKGIRTLLHPKFSYQDGHIYQCVFFPEIIAQIAALEGTEIVSVKPWALNTIFGGFDPSRSYYEGNMWEFINVDAVRYSRLLENRQVVFWGTHDLVSHIAGVQRSAWPELQTLGRKARELFEEYFSGDATQVPYSLVLPYALGMLLDDLAQPMNYDSKSRRWVVDLLIQAIEQKRVRPDSKAFLLKYPSSIENLFALARSDEFENAKQKASKLLDDVIAELNRYSIAS